MPQEDKNTNTETKLSSDGTANTKREKRREKIEERVKEKKQERGQNQNTDKQNAKDKESLPKDNQTSVTTKKTDNSTKTKQQGNMGTIVFRYKDDTVIDAYISGNGKKYRRGKVPVGKYKVYVSCPNTGTRKVRNYVVKPGKNKVFSCECGIGSCS